MVKPHILLVDNKDSFTYNLADYMKQCQFECTTIRGTQLTPGKIKRLNPDGFVFSPGPETPVQHPVLFEILDNYSSKKPIIGVCLGMQAIGMFFGSKLVRANAPYHGKTSTLNLSLHEMYKQIPDKIAVTRYHSLILEGINTDVLEVTAKTDDGIKMSIAHKSLPIWGLQYHPEAILTDCGLKIVNNWHSLFN